jgi:uncharacterized membrane protein
MSAHPDPVLFEAICTPPRSLGRRGGTVLALLVLAGSAGVGALCLAMGAWPVLGFVGVELALVLGLMALHRRWSRRAMEEVVLTGGRLLVRRTDAGGRRREHSLDAYWTRLSLEERPGAVSTLLLRQRGLSLEIGALLGEEQKRDLAEALGAALRRYRDPVFDNPQLRPPPSTPSASGS